MSDDEEQRRMVYRPSRRTVLGLGAAGALMIMSGCRSAVSDNSGGGTPQRGGKLTIAQGSGIDPISPLGQAIYAQSYRRCVYDTLIDIDPTTGRIVPGLATNVDISADNQTVTLTLREGVTWHSGRRFGAQDVAFTVDKAVHDKPPFPLAGMLADLRDVSEVDAKTVRLSFGSPKPNLRDALSLMIMVDSESYVDFRAGKAHVGTGPFRWDELVPNTSLDLARNPAYWRPDRPYLDAITVRMFTQTQALTAAVRAGQVDMGLNLLPLDLDQVRDAGGFEVTDYATFGSSFYVGCNVDVPPLNRVEVRQAIQHAVDRERISNELYKGKAKASAAPWSPVSPAFDPAYVARYRRDLDKAKALLARAGAAGAQVAVEVAQNAAQIANIVSFNLGEIGLEASTTVLTQAVNSDRFLNRSYQGVYIAAHGYNTLSPADLLYGSAPYKAAKDANLFRFDSDEYRRLAAAAAVATPEQQKQAWQELTDFLLDQAFCCDLVQTTNTAVTHGLAGWKYNVWDELLLTDAYLG